MENEVSPFIYRAFMVFQGRLNKFSGTLSTLNGWQRLWVVLTLIYSALIIIWLGNEFVNNYRPLRLPFIASDEQIMEDVFKKECVQLIDSSDEWQARKEILEKKGNEPNPYAQFDKEDNPLTRLDSLDRFLVFTNVEEQLLKECKAQLQSKFNKGDDLLLGKFEQEKGKLKAKNTQKRKSVVKKYTWNMAKKMMHLIFIIIIPPILLYTLGLMTAWIIKGFKGS